MRKEEGSCAIGLFVKKKSGALDPCPSLGSAHALALGRAPEHRERLGVEAKWFEGREEVG